MDIFSLLYLIFLPAAAAFLIACPGFPNNCVTIRRFAKSFAGLHFIYALLFLIPFDSTSFSPAFADELTFFKQGWLQPLGIKANFAADGISLIFVILTSFVTLIALFASKNKIRYSHKLYYSMFFIAEMSILGLLCAQDMFVFFFFLELSLIPLYFLISHWSANEDEKMSRKFLAFNILAGFFILAPMLILYFYNFAITGTLSAGIETLNFDSFSYPDWFEYSIFSSFLLGFWIRTGLFPFHNWFIECVETAKIPVSMFLIACFSTSGIYGILRFNFSALGDTFAFFNAIIYTICLVGIIYLVILMTIKKNLKVIFGYLSIIQNCIITAALGLLNPVAYSGGFFLSVSGSVSLCGLLILALILERRSKRYNIPMPNCLGDYMPKFRIFSYIIFFSTILTPFLSAFFAMFLIFLGSGINLSEFSIAVNVLTILCSTALLFACVFLISIFHQMIFSTSEEKIKRARDISLSEMTMLSLISCAIIFLGVFPTNLINIIKSTLHIAVNIFGI